MKALFVNGSPRKNWNTHKMLEQAMKIVLGYCETLCAYNTYQFTDYSRYAAGMFDEKVKREHRENEFPKDLQKAYELGKRLAEKVAQ